VVEHCYACHSAKADKSRAGLHVDARDGCSAAATVRAVPRSGDPDKSRLVESVRYGNEVHGHAAEGEASRRPPFAIWKRG
jgi:hypothetical protein